MYGGLQVIENGLKEKKFIQQVQNAMGVSQEDTERVYDHITNVLNVIKNDEKGKLQKCTKESIQSACVDSIKLGLTIDARQHTYLVPYGDKAQLQIGWRGYLYKITEFNPSTVMQIGFVWEGDDFSHEMKDGKATYKHIKKNPFRSDYEEAIGIYCFMKYKKEDEWFSSIEFMSMDEIMKVKSINKQTYIWDKWFGEMAKKAIIRRAAKIAFASVVEQLDIKDNEQYDMSLLREKRFDKKENFGDIIIEQEAKEEPKGETNIDTKEAEMF